MFEIARPQPTLESAERAQARRLEQMRARTIELLQEGESLFGLLETLVLGVAQVNPALLGYVMLCEHHERWLRQRWHRGGAAHDCLAIGMVARAQPGSAGANGSEGAAELARHPHWQRFTQVAARAKLGAYWHRPIESATGEFQGSFAIYHPTAYTPSADDEALIEQCALLASVVVERASVPGRLRP